ncbi:hypothetical protein PVK06_030668 [Gossypium arboreum]|uniref:Uncharacterized protein n=1 Tax=Gossypium arboreum TaxID=29729 RepID=A0ABR0NNW3_GOSAR|nr:hypothetical protein PVK06_030668 [Gossypium arboreum]
MEKVLQLEIKNKTMEEQRLADMKQLQKESHEALKKYKEDTVATMRDYLPKLRSNLMLHTEIVVKPFDVRQVYFNCMRKLTTIDLGFDVLYPSGKEWEEFNRNRKSLKFTSFTKRLR